MNPPPHSPPSSFGLAPGGPLSVPSPLVPNSSASTLLPINPGGSVEKMSPLTQLRMAIKNNVDVFYFSINVPMHMLFAENGKMGKNSLGNLEILFLGASIHVCISYVCFLSFFPLSSRR